VLWIAVVTILAVVTQRVPPAHAYTGGPELVEILGWDPSSERIYFHAVPTDESGSFGGTFYFDLKSPKPGTRVQLPWSHCDASYNDSVQVHRLEALRRRLHPVTMKRAAVFPWPPTVLTRDTVLACSEEVPRFTISMNSFNGPAFKVHCYWRPEACIKNVYEIPGHAAWVYVVAFFGHVCDPPAETQVPVLVTPSSGIPEVQWSPGR
jgi:hypothetical protein